MPENMPQAKRVGFLVVILAIFLKSCSCQEDFEKPAAKLPEKDRIAKLLPIFQVVRFPNDACQGSVNNGTCYTSEECSTRGGSSDGSCAEGFGVCCVFVYGCGTMSSENCTYFENNSPVAGDCSHMVCPPSNVCSLRLDFSTFVITGPSTTATSYAHMLNGYLSNLANGVTVAPTGRCTTDSFTVSNQYNLPIICGTMTGEHAYVDASQACNSIDFKLGAQTVGVTSLATRTWKIKVTQISCNDPNRPPSGCDQYYIGATLGFLKSFNYGTGANRHLANQHQTVCFRREQNFCQICFSSDSKTDVSYGGFKSDSSAGAVAGTECCGHGVKGTDTNGGGFDCLMIPGAEKAAGTQLPVSQCANNVGLISAAVAKGGTGQKTVCSKKVPFRIDFMTDAWEKVAGKESLAINQEGFKIRFYQVSC